MKKLALLHMLLLPLAGLLQDVDSARANEHVTAAASGESRATASPPAEPITDAGCNPWSANYWGDLTIDTPQAADRFACYRRVVGSLTIAAAGSEPIALPNLRAVLGDLRMELSGAAQGRGEPARALGAALPSLREVLGDVELVYPRETAAPSDAVSELGLSRIAVRGDVSVRFLATQ